MKRRHVIALVTAAALLGGLVICLVLSGEPSYQGRSLSSWIKSADDSAYTFDTENLANTQFQAALHAVRSIGTNAIPTLLRWAAAKDSGFRHRTLCWLHEHTTVCDGFLDDVDKHFLAELGFRMLGKSSASATPTLLQLAGQSDERVSINALFCLYFIYGEKSAFLPVLQQTIHGPNIAVRPRAAFMLMECYPEEAEKSGVYEIFPRLRPGARQSVTVHPPPDI